MKKGLFIIDNKNLKINANLYLINKFFVVKTEKELFK